MRSEVHHVVSFLGDTHHVIRRSCNIDALSYGRLVIRKQCLCHLISDDTHLTTLVAVEFVDIPADNDALGRHHGQKRRYACHHKLVGSIG